MDLTDDSVKESKDYFREWLESITFVDEDGKPLPTELTEDPTPDPEGDRETE